MSDASNTQTPQLTAKAQQQPAPQSSTVPKVEAAQPQQQAQPQPAPQRPADTLRDGAVKATIWERQGERGAFNATDLSRTYKDQEGNLRDSRSFSGSDLLRVSELAKGAYHRTNELHREKMQARETDQDREARREAHRKARSAPPEHKRGNQHDR